MKRRRFVVGVVGIAAAGAWLAVGRGGEQAPEAPLEIVGAASPTKVDAAAGGDVWVTLRVLAAACDEQERPPVNLGLVVDTSGSMAGAAIEAAKAAAHELIATLREGDRVSLIAFHSDAEVVVSSTDIDDLDRADLDHAIDRMEARGTTDLGAGLAASVADVSRHAGPDITTRIVLLSDGVPNEPLGALAAAAQAAAAGITITALGLGLDYDETLLSSIAQQTGGNFHYVADPAELADAFRAENRRLQDVLARNVRLSLRTGPKVTLAEVVGSNAGTGQGAIVTLGDFSRGEERTVVVRLSVGPHRPGATVELLDAIVSAEDPGTGAALPTERCFVAGEASDDPTAVANASVPEVERAVELARASAATLQAVAATREGNAALAVEILDRALVPRVMPAATSPEAEEQVKHMEGLRDTLRDGGSGVDGQSDDATRHAFRKAHGKAMENLQNRASGS